MSEWKWSKCPDWRERVCRLRDPYYRAAFIAYEMDSSHENFLRAVRAMLTILKMAKARSMFVREMIVRDMPETSAYLFGR